MRPRPRRRGWGPYRAPGFGSSKFGALPILQKTHAAQANLAYVLSARRQSSSTAAISSRGSRPSRSVLASKRLGGRKDAGGACPAIPEQLRAPGDEQPGQAVRVASVRVTRRPP